MARRGASTGSAVACAGPVEPSVARVAVLPFAAVVVGDRAGRVRYADVHADWASITAPGAIRAVHTIQR